MNAYIYTYIYTCIYAHARAHTLTQPSTHLKPQELHTHKNIFELSVLLLSFAWYSRARVCHTSMIYAHTFFPERSWSWISTKSATPPDTALAGMLPPPNSSASDSDAAARALLAGREETWRAMKERRIGEEVKKVGVSNL